MGVITLRAAGKSYARYERAFDRLREVISGRPVHERFIALHPLDLEIGEGEVVGIIGRNGAGKSTLLKLVAGTLTPSQGEVQVLGPVSALLELGTGFHPDLTGRENVLLGGAVKGLSPAQIERLYPEIVAFAGLEGFMDQPIKTYSSGMMMRLAFSVATCVEPSVLIIDEALSVGDSAFAQKSFERIMRFKRDGRTILFCSHSMFQVESICTRVLWLDQGRVRRLGEPAEVVAAYNAWLDSLAAPGLEQPDAAGPADAGGPAPAPATAQGAAPAAGGRLESVRVTSTGGHGRHLQVLSCHNDLQVEIGFVSDPAQPCPKVAVTLTSSEGRVITSAGNWNDGFEIARDADGRARVCLTLPKLPLLKGSYWVNVFLLSHEGIRRLDGASMVAEVHVRQVTLEQGVVSLPRRWSVPRPEDAADAGA